jgi:SAM-dependent methyltransferase
MNGMARKWVMMAVYPVVKIRNVIRGILLAWGGKRIKEWIWNREFSGGRWDCLKDTAGDCVYKFIEKYCNNGSILDLGCGSGNTGNELDITRYNHYTGIDISGVAIKNAIDRIKLGNRGDKNLYYQFDIAKYIPNQKYNVVLFRDSIYYSPVSSIKPLLDRYSSFLKDNGVFIIRICDREAYGEYVELIESHYKLIERYRPEMEKTTVLVFR